jgi:hypothetical protein
MNKKLANRQQTYKTGAYFKEKEPQLEKVG